MSLLVLHCISLPPGQFGGEAIELFFTNRLNPHHHPYFREIIDLKVSAHVLVRRDGSLVQFVPFHKRAWHAGVSCFAGQPNCNDYSVGIELEGTDNTPFEPAQYVSLVETTRALQRLYPEIRDDSIVGHQDIAPGRT